MHRLASVRLLGPLLGVSGPASTARGTTSAVAVSSASAEPARRRPQRRHPQPRRLRRPQPRRRLRLVQAYRMARPALPAVSAVAATVTAAASVYPPQVQSTYPATAVKPQGPSTQFTSPACRSAPSSTHSLQSVLPCVKIADWNLTAEGVSPIHRCAHVRAARSHVSVWRTSEIPAFKPVSNLFLELKLIAPHVLLSYPCATATLPLVKSGVALAALRHPLPLRLRLPLPRRRRPLRPYATKHSAYV